MSVVVMDLLEGWYASGEGNRLVIIPVEATSPCAEPEPAAMPEQPLLEKNFPERIGREELYEDIKDAAPRGKSNAATERTGA